MDIITYALARKGGGGGGGTSNSVVAFTGTGAPTSAIPAKAGDIYTDKSTNKLYQCFNVDLSTLTDLTNVTLIWKDQITYDSTLFITTQKTFNIIGKVNNTTDATGLSFSKENINTCSLSFGTYNFTYIDAFDGKVDINNNAAFTVTGGTDVKNTTLIAYLKENAILTGTNTYWSEISVAPEVDNFIQTFTGSGAPVSSIVAEAGDLYRDTETNKLYQCTQYTAYNDLTNLTGLTVTLKDRIELSTIQGTYTINYKFKDNDAQYTSIEGSYSTGPTVYSLHFCASDSSASKGYSAHYTTSGYKATIDEGYKELTFSGGTAATNTTLINWIKNNTTSISGFGSQWVEVSPEADISTKMNKNNPSGTGTFTMNAGTATGEGAIGINGGQADGKMSFSMNNSHAEGEASIAWYGGTAKGNCSVALKGTAEGIESIAVGVSSKATGNYSIALNGGNATGGTAIAIGGGCNANGSQSIAIGGGTTVGGAQSVGIGGGLNIGGGYTLGLGGGNTSNAKTSYGILACGGGNSAHDGSCFILAGNANTNSASQTFILGSNNISNGSDSSGHYILGAGNTIGGYNYVSIIGNGNEILSPNNFVAGENNKIYGTQSYNIVMGKNCDVSPTADETYRGNGYNICIAYPEKDSYPGDNHTPYITTGDHCINLGYAQFVTGYHNTVIGGDGDAPQSLSYGSYRSTVIGYGNGGTTAAGETGMVKGQHDMRLRDSFVAGYKNSFTIGSTLTDISKSNFTDAYVFGGANNIKITKDDYSPFYESTVIGYNNTAEDLYTSNIFGMGNTVKANVSGYSGQLTLVAGQYNEVATKGNTTVIGTYNGVTVGNSDSIVGYGNKVYSTSGENRNVIGNNNTIDESSSSSKSTQINDSSVFGYSNTLKGKNKSIYDMTLVGYSNTIDMGSLTSDYAYHCTAVGSSNSTNSTYTTLVGYHNKINNAASDDASIFGNNNQINSTGSPYTTVIGVNNTIGESIYKGLILGNEYTSSLKPQGLTNMKMAISLELAPDSASHTSDSVKVIYSAGTGANNEVVAGIHGCVCDPNYSETVTVTSDSFDEEGNFIKYQLLNAPVDKSSNPNGPQLWQATIRTPGGIGSYKVYYAAYSVSVKKENELFTGYNFELVSESFQFGVQLKSESTTLPTGTDSYNVYIKWLRLA